MLAQTSTLDLVASSKDKRHWVLGAAIEAGEWQLPDVKRLLQDKLYAYATYASDGQMQREHRVPSNAKITILVRHVDPIPSEIAEFIDQIAAILAKEGLTVTVEPLPTAEAA